MMSTSPQAGQRPCVPIIQKAGHDPARVSIFARISNRPKSQECLPRVVMLAEVISIVGRFCQPRPRRPVFPSASGATYRGFGFVSFRASITRQPSLQTAFSG